MESVGNGRPYHGGGSMGTRYGSVGYGSDMQQPTGVYYDQGSSGYQDTFQDPGMYQQPQHGGMQGGGYKSGGGYRGRGR